MLDPINLGIVLGGVTLVVSLYCFFFSGGDDFDKVYPNDVRKILTGNDKTKPAAKNQKKQASKDKKVDKEPAQATTKGKKSGAGNTKNKKTAEVENLNTEESPVVERPSEPSITADAATSITSTKSTVQETKSTQDVQPVLEELSHKIQVSTENAVPKKAKKAMKTEKLDSGKVLAALTKIPEIDQAYIGFLQVFVKDSSQHLQKVDRLNRDIEKGNFEKHEMQERLAKAVRAKDAAEHSLATSAKTVDELRHKYQTLSTENAEARVKINHLQQKAEQEESNISGNVHAAQAEAARWKAEFAKSKEVIEAVTEKYNNVTSQLEEAQSKLITEQQQSSIKVGYSIEKMEELNSVCEDLRRNFAEREETTARLTAENLELQSALAAKQRDVEDRLQVHRKEADSRLEEQRSAAELEKNRIMEDYKSLQRLVENLNSEVARFEQYKVELEEREKALSLKQEVPENSALVAQLQEENRQLKEKNLAVEAEKALLKKTADELSEAVAYQQEKHNELRARNFTIVEHSKKSCKSDASAHSVIDSTRATSEAQKQTCSKKQNSTVIDVATGEHLLNLLNSALNDLDSKETSALKKSSPPKLVSTNMIVSEMKQCLKLKKQICDLHESLTNTSGQLTISNPSIKSDESDWELVN